ncbi:hypothetical protein ADIWIN_1459 [Winogradskyella psychrotolerans RS-3]|uniref:DarT domain-containing protein n=1 Tax=Winogradskyella psychrotolerans RS-3 TaxID=641526 RepID=S7X322_9FLAO|nr:DUF4433 domain-containing protein [Winogradskyella psychrotolerans]EPR73429.1 hypothetical protein ADIWIN_1459 [Winogradskyella psychrotolerans RS-3]
MIKTQLDSFNKNTYVHCLNEVFDGLNLVDGFLLEIEKNRNYRNIESIISVYDKLFGNGEISNHIDYKIGKVYKPLYVTNPGEFSKSNSYWHIRLKLNSTDFILLDELYEKKLSNLLRFLKHLFSKIDNFFASSKITQLNSFKKLLENIKCDIEKFLLFIEHRSIINKKEKLDEAKIKQIPFGGLYYTAHIENINSILEKGILSHNLAHSKGLLTVDISNKQVNERRNRVVVGLNGNLHDYAPLYFNPRNPMLYYLCKNRPKENLVLMRINPHILMEDDVSFSDGNAASRTTKFYNNLDDFNNLNWTTIQNEYWTNYPDGKRIKCSEVLVKKMIPMYYVTDLFVYNQNALKKVISFFPNHLGIKTEIKNNLYY